MKVVVTGASGYVGQRVVARLTNRGHEVVTAGRRPGAGALQAVFFDLSQPGSVHLPSGIGAVVHLAAYTAGQPDSGSVDTQFEAALALLREAQKQDARFIFVSSQTARADASTDYGRIKWKIEQAILAAHAHVVRPGQVYGGLEQGLFGTLVGLVRRLPVLPAFVPSPKVQPVHVDDLALVLATLAEPSGVAPGLFCVGAVQPVSFTALLREIARQRLHVARVFVPVPTMLVRTARRLLGGRVPALERLGSLVELPVMQTSNDMQRLGVVLRPLAQGMQARGNGGRRALLRESLAMLSYVLAERPGQALLRRQVRAVIRLRGAAPLELPGWALRWPASIAVLEEHAGSGVMAEFNWRLDCATVLAEATPQGARCFLGLGQGHGWLRASCALAGAVVAEAGWRLARALCAPLLNRKGGAGR